MGDMDFSRVIEVVRAEQRATRAEIKATTDIIGYKLQELVDHQVIQNGRLEKLEKRTGKIEQEGILHARQLEKTTRETSFWRWVQRNGKTSVIIVVSLLFILFLLFQVVDIDKIVTYLRFL